MNNTTIIIRIHFAVTLFQHHYHLNNLSSIALGRLSSSSRGVFPIGLLRPSIEAQGDVESSLSKRGFGVF
jgi:hypothetical protein